MCKRNVLFLCVLLTFIAGRSGFLLADLTEPIPGKGDQSVILRPIDKLEATVDRILNILRDIKSGKSLTQNNSVEIRDAIESSFSFDQITKRALGRNLGKFTAIEVGVFTKEFTTMLINTYVDKFLEFNITNVAFEKEVFLSTTKMEVKTQVSANTGGFAVSYRLLKLEDSWEVYDVIIEGVSLVGNYRTQFDSYLERGSVSKLINHIAEMNKQRE